MLFPVLLRAALKQPARRAVAHVYLGCQGACNVASGRVLYLCQLQTAKRLPCGNCCVVQAHRCSSQQRALRPVVHVAKQNLLCVYDMCGLVNHEAPLGVEESSQDTHAVGRTMLSR